MAARPADGSNAHGRASREATQLFWAVDFPDLGTCFAAPGHLRGYERVGSIDYGCLALDERTEAEREAL